VLFLVNILFFFAPSRLRERFMKCPG